MVLLALPLSSLLLLMMIGSARANCTGGYRGDSTCATPCDEGCSVAQVAAAMAAAPEDGTVSQRRFIPYLLPNAFVAVATPLTQACPSPAFVGSTCIRLRARAPYMGQVQLNGCRAFAKMLRDMGGGDPRTAARNQAANQASIVEAGGVALVTAALSGFTSGRLTDTARDNGLRNCQDAADGLPPPPPAAPPPAVAPGSCASLAEFTAYSELITATCCSAVSAHERVQLRARPPPSCALITQWRRSLAGSRLPARGRSRGLLGGVCHGPPAHAAGLRRVSSVVGDDGLGGQRSRTLSWGRRWGFLHSRRAHGGRRSEVSQLGSE